MAKPSATTTHWAVERSVSKCWAMVGRATDMPPWLTTDISVPRATEQKTHHLYEGLSKMRELNTKSCSLHERV